MSISTQHVQKRAGTHAVSTSACEQSDRYLHNIIMSLQNTPSAHTLSPRLPQARSFACAFPVSGVIWHWEGKGLNEPAASMRCGI